MASVTQKVPNYVMGISTQPDEKKIPGQVVDLVNGVPDVVDQLIKRPGSNLVSTITPDTADNAKWFDIYTTDTEQYIGQVAADGEVKVWRASDGAVIPVDYADIAGSGVATYLDNTSESDEKSSDIQVLTINETTFFVNRKKTVAMKTAISDKSPPQLNEAFINLDTISYGKQYALDIYDPADNTTYSHTRATSLSVGTVSDSAHYSGTSNGDCLGMGREVVTISAGTDKCGTSPPNMSANGQSRLRYEMDIRCTPQPTGTVDDSYTYHDTYQAFPKLQFGGEGWDTGDTHQYTSAKGVQTTITVTNHVTLQSRANIAMVRPEATSSSADEHVSAAGILGGIKTSLDAISGTGITTTVVGNGIHLYSKDPFGVTSPEQQLMTITTTEANNIADLPRTCRHGYTVRIVNSGEDVDDYYLRFQAEGISDDIVQTGTYARSGSTVTVTATGHGLANGSDVILDFTSGAATDGQYTITSVADANTFTITDSASGTISAGETVTIHPCRYGEGVWEEVAKPGVTTTFDNTTMPLKLVRVLPSIKHTIATSAVNIVNNRITITDHNRATGDALLYDNGGGTALAGLTDDTVYYVIKYDADTIKLATSAANATAGIGIDLTGTGNNAQTLTYRYFSINGAAVTAHTNGAFRFGYPDWGERTVGDDLTNPEPSFVGQTIEKMVFFRNRIGLLSEENVILSRVNQYYHFWVKTAMAISNGDPIDLQASSTYPTKLSDAIESSAGLVLFSASEQFLLTSGAEALLTPETAKVSFLSSYGFNPDSEPISLGTTIGFLNSTVKNARFFEMADVDPRREPSVFEQSKIVSKLLPANTTIATGSNENNLVLFATDSTLYTASNEVWGYKFYMAEGKRAQSAWFRWTLPNNVVFHVLLDDKYYVVLNTGSTYTLEKFDIKLHSDTDLIGTSPDQNRVHLDTRSTFASADLTYNSSVDTTTFTLGEGYYSSRTLTAYCTTASDAAGKSYDIPASAITGTAPNQTVTLPGNWKTSTEAGSSTTSVNTDLIIGYEYEFEIELPKVYIVKKDGNRTISETRGSLIIHRMNFDFGDVGVIDVTLKRRGRDDYTYTVESLEWDNVLSSTATIASGYLHTIPVYDRNDNLSVFIKSNHPSPATLFSMNWEGDYSPRYYQRV
jgi:hypothetical protein